MVNVGNALSSNLETCSGTARDAGAATTLGARLRPAVHRTPNRIRPPAPCRTRNLCGRLARSRLEAQMGICRSRGCDRGDGAGAGTVALLREQRRLEPPKRRRPARNRNGETGSDRTLAAPPPNGPPSRPACSAPAVASRFGDSAHRRPPGHEPGPNADRPRHRANSDRGRARRQRRRQA